MEKCSRSYAGFSGYQDNNFHLQELSLRSSCIYLLFRENKIVLYWKIAIFEFVVVLLPRLENYDYVIADQPTTIFKVISYV